MTSSSKVRRNVPPPVGTVADKAAYARFIPREELSSFAAWQLGELTGAAAAARPAEPEPAPADPAQELANHIKAARESGYHDGYRDGLVALEAFKLQFAQQATQQVGTLLQSITGQLDALQEEMAEALGRAATSLARQIVRSELQTRPEAVASVAHEALEALLLSARHITLRVHPDDEALVAVGAGDLLAARGARLVADASITRGGCRVESDVGGIDAQMEARWCRAVASIGRSEPWCAAVPPTAGAAPAPGAPA